MRQAGTHEGPARKRSQRLRIVYIMHVDWDWIMQRPHFIATHLAGFHDLLIFYPFSRQRRHLVRNRRERLSLIPFVLMPFGWQVPVIYWLNTRLAKITTSLLFQFYKPDAIWMTSPEFFDCLPRKKRCPLIYDCMDDLLAFPDRQTRRSRIRELEHRLIKDSDWVICSSENLKAKLNKRYSNLGPCVVVPNAYSHALMTASQESFTRETITGRLILGYIGTVSSWLDWAAILRVVQALSGVEVHIIGPVEVASESLPRHPRIVFRGPVPHEALKRDVCGFDVLIMPFVVNELIESVDPVKLYEYILFNKPVISVYYEEVRRFERFVEFYQTSEELVSLVERMYRDGARKKYSDRDREEFLKGNTWQDRCEKILALFMRCCGEKSESRNDVFTN